ncbi:MAG TPA: AbrB/MazE/SpoVT family DNA-binding domain-containing protein [Nitrososphaerales archaeon]|nr:AbrB/MazE/SpoVT family DNA-binding domain-containing protein [Nitrososphaerales archaeon]
MSGSSTVKVTRNRQVTIPAHLANTAGIREGDILDVRLEDQKIILKKSKQQKLPSFKIGRKLKESDIELLIESSLEEIVGS